MPKYDDIVQVDRLKNLAETLGWKVSSEAYFSDSVTITLFRKISDELPKEE